MRRLVQPRTIYHWPVKLIAQARMPLHRNALALVTSAGVTSVLGLVYWTVAARTYDAVEVGTQSAVLSAMLLVGGMAEFGADTVFMRFLPAAGASARRLVRTLYTVTATAAVCGAVVFVVGTVVWAPTLTFLRTDGRWFCAFTASTAVACLFAVQDSVLTGVRRAGWVALENGIVSVLKIVLLVAFAAVFGAGGIFASWSIPTALAVAVVTGLIFRRLLTGREGGASRLPSRAVLARYMAGNYVASLFALVTINAMPLIVINRLGAAPAAHFFVPWAIFNGLQLFATGISYSLIVEAAADESQTRVLFRRALLHAVVTLTPISLVLLLWGPSLLSLLGRSYVEGGGELLRWLAAAAIPAIMTPLAVTLARLRNRADVVVLIQATNSILVLGGSYLAVDRFGVDGIGVVTLVVGAAMAVVLASTVLRSVVWSGPRGQR